MLKKVLKYDFKSVFKYWWIGLVASFGLSVLGGFGLLVSDTPKELPVAVELFCNLSMILAVMSYFAFILFAEILVFVRYYKNFYTDEGYLTFTLPVKKSTLLNSKLILGLVTSIVTFLGCLFNGLSLLAIAFYEDVFTKQFVKDILDGIKDVYNHLGALLFVYIIEVLLLVFFVFLLSILIMYVCICVGSLVAKKSKILTSVGLIYGVNTIGTVTMSIYYTVINESIWNWFSVMSEAKANVANSLVLGILVFFVAMLCVIVYGVHYRLLDKKLNLQ